MSALREHLARELATKVERYGIVIWDDPDAAYSAVVREVVPAGATVSVFDRSWFDLRHQIEPLLAGPKPPELVVYIPAKPMEPDPLEELRAVGTKWTIKLPTLIKQALAGQITDQRVAELGQQCSTIGEAEAALAGPDSSLDARLVALVGDGSAVAVTGALVSGTKESEIATQGLEGVARTTLSASIGGSYDGLAGDELRRAAFRQIVLAPIFELSGALPEELQSSFAETSAAQRKLAIDVVKRLQSSGDDRSVYVELAGAADTDLHLGRVL